MGREGVNRMNNDLRNVLSEIDALAEKWDDHGAFDFLDEDPARTEPKKRTSAWRRGTRWLGRANLWWVPLAASIVVLLFAWQQANRAAEIERMNTAAAQELVEEKAAWQDLQKERIQKSRDKLREVMASGDYEEALQLLVVLKSLGGWGDDLGTPDAQTLELIENSGRELVAQLREAANAIEAGTIYSLPED